MIRFQCPHCRGIIAAETWEPGAPTVCAYCSKEVKMPAERLAPGAVLGDFMLVRKLGVGGMGVVYLAHQLSLDRPAAIKVLNSEYSKEAESVKAFIREARSAAKLNHPNIVQAYAVGEDEGIFFFAMEYIDGKTMKQVLQEKGKLDPKEAASVIMQAANGLDCAWKEQKLVHHDIKPDNIMQCANDRVKVADLGLSQVFGEDANDDSDEVLGTPQYISPEQLTGVVTDTRSDIYSLGATFYHLVTGQFPYNAENTDEIAKQHVYGTLNPPKNVNPALPQKLNDIIVKMMAKKPEERFQNCEDLAKALKDYLEKGDAPAGGLMGNTLSQATPKLGGGLSGGGVQPKLAVPSSPTKLSLKIADRVNKSEDAEKAPAETPASEKAPVITPPASGGIKLKVASAAKEQEPPQEEAEEAEATEATEATEAAEDNAVEDKAAAPEAVLAENPPAEESEEADETPAEENEDNTEDEAGEVAAEATIAENENGEKNEEDDDDKSSGGLIVLIIVTVFVLLVAGGGVWYYMSKKNAKPTAPVQVEVKKAPVKVAEKKEAPKVAEPVIKQPEVVVQVQQMPKQQQLSVFMREAKRLESMLLSNERQFVSAWPAASRKLKPAKGEEERFMKQLDDSYLDAHERVYVLPARKELLDRYNKTIANIEKRAEQSEYIERIKNAEKEAFALAESSAANYDKDLMRKMSMLDYAMINYVKSGSKADLSVFNKAIALAKAEPKRVADREGFQKSAEVLADYAGRLEFAAKQAREFPGELQKNKFKNRLIGQRSAVMEKVLKRYLAAAYEKGIKDKKSRIQWGAFDYNTFEIDWKNTFKLVSTNRNALTFTVGMEITPKVIPPKKAPKGKKGKKPPKPKPPKPVKLTAVITVNIPGQFSSGTLSMGRVRLPLPKGELSLPEIRDFVHCVEILHGKSDWYFYYMLGNCNMRERLSVIAPDEFWKKRVDYIPRGYFKRAIFLANDAQLANLKKVYGKWLSFQNALKEMTEEK